MLDISINIHFCLANPDVLSGLTSAASKTELLLHINKMMWEEKGSIPVAV